MTKLVLSKETAEKVMTILNQITNHNVEVAPFNNEEMAFLIPKKDQAIFFKTLVEVIDQINELWFDTYDGQTKFYPSNCMYFEVIGEEVILMTDFYKKVSLRYTLQDLEDKLSHLEFQRISKSVIVNFKKISHIKPLVNSKFEITLIGDLKLEVNRSYIKAFKQALKEKGGF